MAWILYFALFLLFMLLGVYLPWWVFLIPVFIGGFFMPRAKQCGVLSFVLGFVLWASVALYRDMMTGARLSHRLADLFGFPNAFLLILVTGLLSGVVCMLAGLSGFFLRSLFRPRSSELTLSSSWEG